jgi:hypothetical protein
VDEPYNDGMSEEPKKKRVRAWFVWAPILLLLLAYVLSIGPAYSHAVRSSGDANEARKMLDTTYAPIVWLARHSAPVRKAIDRYMSWWL